MARFQSLLLRGFYLAIFAPIFVGGCRPRETAAPNIDALKHVLGKSAEARLAAPEITDERIILRQPAADREATAQRILGLIADAGGIAIRSDLGNGAIELLVSAPVSAGLRAKLTGRAQAESTPAADTVSFVVALIDPE